MSFRYTLFLVLRRYQYLYEKRDEEFPIPLAIGMTIRMVFDVGPVDDAGKVKQSEHIFEVRGLHYDQRTKTFSAQLLVPRERSDFEVAASVSSPFNEWRLWEFGHEPRGFPLSWRLPR